MPPGTSISAFFGMTNPIGPSPEEWRSRKRTTDVLGYGMAHVEMGEGPPVLFLHGNPTSSFLWRDVMERLDNGCRKIAPDLIGMGDSDKLSGSGPDRYTLAEHARFFDAWIDAVQNLVKDGRLTKLEIAKVDGQPVRETPYAARLEAAGFSTGYRGMTFRG